MLLTVPDWRRKAGHLIGLLLQICLPNRKTALIATFRLHRILRVLLNKAIGFISWGGFKTNIQRDRGCDRGQTPVIIRLLSLPM